MGNFAETMKLLAVAVVAGTVSFSAVARGEEAADTPAPATEAKPAKRNIQQIQADMKKVGTELQEALPSLKDVVEGADRKDIAPKAIPPLKKMVGLFNELGVVLPAAKPQIATQVTVFTSILVLLGDEETSKTVEKAAAGKDAEAHRAQAIQGLAAYWKDPKDATAQGKVLDTMLALAKADPKNDSVAQVLAVMSEAGAATPEVGKRAKEILMKETKGELQQQLAGEQKVAEAEGKPIVLAGELVTGEKFSTADWKGKVILVDFWATWCGPCLGELPHVKKIYKQYHEKGLEIVGISCDKSAEALKKFIEKNAEEMPWPQMFDAANPGWHPLAKEYGVQGIPTMFLIDRNGVLRTMSARQNMDEMIPKLLEEKAGAAPDAKDGDKKDADKKDGEKKDAAK